MAQRGRPRKIRPEIENVQTAGEFLEGAGVREVNRTIRRTFQVEVPIDQLDQTPQPDIDEADDFIADDEMDSSQEPVTDNEAPDWMDSLWNEVGAKGPNFTMIIYRLIDYDKDKRFDRGTRRINCGTRPFTPDFEEDIRREFARPGLVNHFTLTIRANGKFYKTWPGVISLEPPPIEIIQEELRKQQTIASLGSPQPASAVLLQQQTGTTLGDAIKYLRELNELQDSITPPWIREMMKRPPQYDQPQQQAAQPSGEITTEQALFKLATQDPDVVEKLSERLLGKVMNENPTDESWSKTLAPVFAQIAPSLVAILAGIAQRFIAPQQPQQSAEQSQPQQLQAAQPVSREQEFFEIVLSDLQQRRPAKITARRLFGFADAFPEIAQWLDVLAQTPAEQLLAQTASMVPEAAALTAQPESLEWLRALQAELNREEQEEAADE